MDDPSLPAEPSGPPVPPESAEELYAQAETARHKQVWEEAIRLYRFALQKSPNHKESIQGLALAYQEKSREPGYESYFQSAVGEYRKLVLLDPLDPKAHDALLAAVLKADTLDALLDDYKRLAAQSSQPQIFKDGIRKIQTLLLLRTSNVKKGPPPLPGFVNLIFSLIAPGVAVVALIAGVIVRLKGQTDTSTLFTLALFKTSFAAFFSFIGYKIFVYLRSR